MTITEYKNLIDEDLINDLELYLSSIRMSWTYAPATVSFHYNPVFEPCDKIIDAPQLVSMVYYKDNVINHEIYIRTMPLITAFMERERLWNAKVDRIKVNTLLQKPDMPLDCFNIPHIDFDGYDKSTDFDRYITLIYYVNDSDGDTFIFSRLEDGSEKSFILEIEKTITPEKGKLSAFPARQYHASSNPRCTDRRIVINIVLKV